MTEEPIKISKKPIIIDSESSYSSGVPDTSSSLDSTSSNNTELDNDLRTDYEKIEPNCANENFYSPDCNKFLLKKELLESNYLAEHPDETPYLYPNLNDNNFNVKIATKKEFNDTKYDGKIHEDIKEYSDALAKADFELQPHQAFVKNFLSFQTPYSSLLLYHGLGTGKCHSKGTPIMMSDGSIKLVENIKEGDFLMGDDSMPRKVLSIATGQDKMYDIIPVKGDKYKVNQEHILCLKASGNSETIEIAVKDYLKLSEKKKALLKSYKVPVNFEEKELPFDPYMIGYWLGDGISKVNQNDFIKELDLLNNKHIPMIYKCNSRENRLKLLAGLLDSNGHLDNTDSCFELCLEKETLINDVIYLTRSLGFACYKAEKKIGIIHIYGEGLEEIPSQILCPRKQIKDALVTGIKVEYVNEDDYYGFTLDGNCRYLMGDFSVTHNTCSAIGVCEEMRDYMKQMGVKKRIIIVASENVQDNFKLQLFDERKLKLTDGVWNIRACTGNKLLQEINPMNMKGLTKEKVVSQIKSIINAYYIFMGYVQFANYIIKTMNYTEEVQKQRKEKIQKGKKSRIQMLKDVKIDLNSRIIKRLRNEFDNRLIVIDEVHNIRKTDDNENKKVAINLELLVRSAQNMRFLLLSATPMYNSYKEIVWLLNLMNTNDRRGRVEVKDIFDKNGNFKAKGEEMLTRKATGYISFVRGENPYTFPYRIYPSEFSKKDTFSEIEYPSYQMNLKKIKYEDKNKKPVLDLLYLTKLADCKLCGKCQYCAYKYIINNLRNKQFSITTKTGIVKEMPSFENMESFGYTLLQTPLESLIISYPVPGLKELLDEIPVETMSDDFSPSFAEMTPDQADKEIDEDLITGPVEDVGEESEETNKTLLDTEKESEETNKTLLDTEKESEETSKTLLDTELESTEKDFSKTLVGGMHIDPHLLTGRIGLERMMSFVDTRVPPVKGDFEYRKATLDSYGRIFSVDQIGNYSAKIKTILENIAESEGVILIYSQYLDSGLIPMALALEEMGFTRYGDSGAKSLFKTPPTPVIDVRTMKPPHDKKDFAPARYTLITGEPRLSPNNEFEVKGSTGDDNRDGKKVKVILISKAGSEGIDFKFIRQVHILEPWYNMNRSEQIIGRAVRNFSHKDLPFEKRNVEIFMYGTILGDNKEEAADLYVYRVAEYKAIQIGKVSRVLKETAVDCIIHHDQTNFTQDNIEKKLKSALKEPITQILSNGDVLTDFKIGDAPFSPACDYMAKCDYDCRPNAKIDEKQLNEDTYDEKFILMNTEKILQRIRMLMKESFFYKKDVLLREIRIQKEYPFVQIFAALTQLIDDQNEFITDKYGRDGRLINIGEYYLFQPVELRDKNTTLFDRSVPIDYKHDMVKFAIKKDIAKSVVEKKKTAKIANIPVDESYPEGRRLLDEMKINFDLCLEFTKKSSVPRGDDNWFKHCGIVMKKMTKDYPDSKEMLIPFLVAHMLETHLFEEKLEIMNYLYSLEKLTRQSLEWYAKEYFQMNSITTKNFTAFIMYNLGKRIILTLDENNQWTTAEPEDQREIASSKAAKDLLSFVPSDYNKIIGFIGYEKSNRFLVFKTKDITSKRDTGARCDESGKIKTMQKLNEILGEEIYTKESTKAQKKGKDIISEAVGQVELCVTQEFILRYFNTIKRDGKQWFLMPELAIWHKMYTL